MEHDYDVLVVGSGFGGSVAVLRATEKGYRVGVLEAGRSFSPEDFPPTNWRLRRFLFMPRLGLRGIQRITLLRDVLVLSGAGVGGGSLVYAGVLYEALDPGLREELAPYYEIVREMLGAAEVPFETPAEDVLRRVAERMGAAETFRRTTVAVDFDTCVRCGGCMVGCRYGAKNTLDRNYLRLAEERGAQIHAEREAFLLRRAGPAGARSSAPIRSSSRQACSGRCSCSSAPASAARTWASVSARTPSRSWARPRRGRTWTIPSASRSARPSSRTRTRTSSRCAIRAART